MRTQFIRETGEANGIDFSARFRVRGCSGIAFYLLGWAVKFEPVICFVEDKDGNEVEIGEFESVPDFGNVVAVMVGDDRRHVVEVDDLQELDEKEFCHVCGQIGCTHDGLEREQTTTH